jgi:hypothetical protein
MDVDETRDFRLIHSADRQITDSRSCVRLCATQYSDGSLDDLGIEVFGDDNDLNSDQARELAAVLLEAADELDRWAAMSDDPFINVPTEVLQAKIVGAADELLRRGLSVDELLSVAGVPDLHGLRALVGEDAVERWTTT